MLKLTLLDQMNFSLALNFKSVFLVNYASRILINPPPRPSKNVTAWKLLNRRYSGEKKLAVMIYCRGILKNSKTKYLLFWHLPFGTYTTWQYIKFPREATDLSCYIPKLIKFMRYLYGIKILYGMFTESLFLLFTKESSEEDKREKSAVKIQAAFRGYLAREMVKKMKKGNLQEETTQENNWGNWFWPPETWKK